MFTRFIPDVTDISSYSLSWHGIKYKLSSWMDLGLKWITLTNKPSFFIDWWNSNW